jgi:hypothetical protein
VFGMETCIFPLGPDDILFFLAVTYVLFYSSNEYLCI